MKKILYLTLLFQIIANYFFAQETGSIAYYSDEFNGRKTASGELYDKSKNTAAHKNLPFGSYVKVTRLDNGKSTVVRINDRGPYIKGRIMDVSKAAAQDLGFVSEGDVRVTIEPVNGEVESTSATTITQQQDAVKQEPEKVKESSVQEKVTAPEPKPVVAPDPPKKEQPKPAPTSKNNDTKKIVRSNNYRTYDLYKVQVMRPLHDGWGVQVSSLKTYENVLKQIANLQDDWYDNILVSVEEGSDKKPIYKIILGPFPDKDTAESYRKHVKKKGMKGFVIDLRELDYSSKSK
ncbi:MAG: septal ring lytic transglycosylase RlpA family protein [Saprospiraceae bacterium]|nr:septal ring lytic transglycosylase RlpA family protein [Saprospiraceae bacterium]